MDKEVNDAEIPSNEEVESIIKIFSKALEKFRDDTRKRLIDKSVSDDEISEKAITQHIFAREYGFFMPVRSMRIFWKLEERLKRRDQYIIKPLMLFTRIRYWLYIIYIKLKQEKLRRRVRQRMKE